MYGVVWSLNISVVVFDDDWKGRYWWSGVLIEREPQWKLVEAKYEMWEN